MFSGEACSRCTGLIASGNTLYFRSSVTHRLHKHLAHAGPWDVGPPPPAQPPAAVSEREELPAPRERGSGEGGAVGERGTCTCLSGPPPASGKGLSSTRLPGRPAGGGGGVKLIHSLSLNRPSPKMSRTGRYLDPALIDCGFPFRIQSETPALPEPREVSIGLTGPGGQVCGWTAQEAGKKGEGTEPEAGTEAGQTSEDRPSSNSVPGVLRPQPQHCLVA